jgi:hypothetical protein
MSGYLTAWFAGGWSGWRDSNPSSSAWKAEAQPLYHARLFMFVKFPTQIFQLEHDEKYTQVGEVDAHFQPDHAEKKTNVFH